MAPVADKAELRRRFRAVAPLNEEQVHALCGNLYRAVKRHPAVRQVLVFLPTKKEPDLTPLYRRLLEEGYALYAPRCGRQGQMEFYRFDTVEQCAPGLYGILEPTGDERPSCPRPLMLVPGLAFTADGVRLGKGGGYYDRYLAAHPCIRIGVCPSACLAGWLPAEAYDIPVDEVVTERKESHESDKRTKEK